MAPSEADICTAAEMPTFTPGTFTVGTDNPAYPPYFEAVDTPTDPWELGDPTTGNGFERCWLRDRGSTGVREGERNMGAVAVRYRPGAWPEAI